MLQPLQGKEILITREKSQSKSFADLIVAQDGIPIEIPLLKITCKSYDEKLHLFERLKDYQWIFFTSANGVHCFFQWIKKYLVSLNKLDSVQFAVVGHKTEKALLEYGVSASFVPSVYNAEVMADEFLQQNIMDGPLLIVKGNRSRKVLQEAFMKSKVVFDEIVTYETESNRENQTLLNDYFNKQYPDFLTFTSPSSVEAFMEMNLYAEHLKQVLKIPCVCIGTTTEAHAKELGFVQTLVPNQYTIEGMVETIAVYIKAKG
ncbi:uroporphyrinogen-III synthase [Virgibacillus necropolis]|uniref:uroporphyrinogen-III synthase n=1 Tax=Virgibacillus necropolis TaxID=163877 RepID=UPI00384D90E4